MINPKLLDPKSIVVCGASSDIHKPGGKALKNLLESAFNGQVYAVNPKETEVQGVKCYAKVDDLPQVEPNKKAPRASSSSAQASRKRAMRVLKSRSTLWMPSMQWVAHSSVPTARASSTPTTAAASIHQFRNSTPKGWISLPVQVPPPCLSRNMV